MTIVRRSAVPFVVAFSLCVSFGFSSVSAEDNRFAISTVQESHTDIAIDGRRVARYMHAYDKSTPERLHETYKPYLHVFGVDNKTPITKGPGGQFTHHRGIFIGWNRVQSGGQSYDLWHMKGVEQVHQRFLKSETTGDEAVLTSLVHWNDKEKKPLIVEERTMKFRRLDGPGIVEIDFDTVLTAQRDLKLNGDPEHAGVQYRPANEVDRKRTKYFFPKEDADPKKDLDYAWAGETYTLGERVYTVIHLNHPDNPKGTKYSAYRDYGRFGAFFTRDLAAKESLRLRYRFLVYTGHLPPPVGIVKAASARFGRGG